MRLFFLLVSFLLLGALRSQTLLEQEITVSFSSCSIEKCFRLIGAKSSLTFSYNSRQISSLDNKVTASFENTAISQILDEILRGTRLAYRQIGKQITIYEVSSSSETVVLSGYIRERATKEEIIGAKISFPDYSMACLANSYGYYAIEIPKGPAKLLVSSVGMMRMSDDIIAEADMVVDFYLDEDTVFLAVVDVVADSLVHFKPVADLPGLDKTEITKQTLMKVPAVNGETDVLKYLQQLPGVTAEIEGGATYRVRGSGTGNNLILLDEIPIYHPTHLLGLYSIVNTDALKSATLYKDFIPLNFGARNASVLQIHTKEGNLSRHELSGSLGFVSTRLNWEGPIVKNKASFYLSGRRSALPSIAGQFLNNQELSLPKFFDLNGKVNIHLNSNNRLYLTAYLGEDNLNDSSSTYSWGNTAVGLRWNHVFNSKTFANTSVTHSEFDYGYILSTGYALDNFRQRVVTDRAGMDVTNFFRGHLKFNYGISVTWLRTRFGNESVQSSTLFLQRNAFEAAGFFSFEKRINRKIKFEAGIRAPFSFHIGTQDTAVFLHSDFTTEEVVFERGGFYDPQFFIDPRALMTITPDQKNQFQFSGGIVSQNTHVVNYVHYFLPVEIWTTANKFLRPERNLQTSFAWTHLEKNINWSVAAFHKFVWNVPDYAVPAFTPSSEIESNLLTGNMTSIGAELMFRFILGAKYSVTAGYTYMISNQQVKGINGGNPYPSTNSRPHNLTVSQFLNLSKKWMLSTNFTWHSGKAVTLPNGQFVINGTAFPVYDSNRNAERLPFFSRWDLSATRKFGWKKKREFLNLSISVTNITGRFNPAIVYVRPEVFAPQNLQTIGRDYTPFMIYLSLNFKI